MKHRIVGSLVLVSLAVIILPFWLDGAGLQEYQNQNIVLAEPEMVELAVIETVDPSEPSVIELSPIETLSETIVEPSADSLLNTQGLPNGWVVQLGSFGNQTNAIRLTEKLVKSGFNAHMVPKTGLFKVLVGPELDRNEAQVLKAKLKSQFKMTGIVIRYEIDKL